MNDIKNKRIERWILAGSWAGFIYATLYIVRPICDFFAQYSWFSFSVNISIVLCIGVFIGLGFKARKVRRLSTYLLLILVISGYGLGMKLISIPAERIHFIEYGILAYLVYRALILDINNKWVYLWALLIASLIGAGDEAIQYFLPNRHYEFRDICLNSASAALGLFFVYVINRQAED